jgi:antitoxin VapB
MATAKLFQNGRSQAVRLPKEFRLQGKEVKISRQGNKIILEPIEDSWEQWFASMEQFSGDFMANGREPPEQPQERDWSAFE